MALCVFYAYTVGKVLQATVNHQFPYMKMKLITYRNAR